MSVVGQHIGCIEPENTEHTSWGSLCWLIDERVPGAQQTLGVVTINPGKSNPLHRHPNCEEILYVVSGECDHRVGDDVVRLKSGSAVCIPQNAPHQARVVGEEPLVVVVSYSSPRREVENLENDDTA